MIDVITAENAFLFQNEMEEVYRLRHKVFVEEKGWRALEKPDGREQDQFDTDDAVHMICRREGSVVGYQRMLPTTKPHLLSTVLSDLCEVERPEGPNIWEWTRFCITKPYRGRVFSPVSNALVSAIVEWCIPRDINRIVIEMEPIWLLRLVQLNFMVTPLGIPRQMGNESVVAVVAQFDERTLQMLQDMRGNSLPAINSPSIPVSAQGEVTRYAPWNS